MTTSGRCSTRHGLSVSVRARSRLASDQVRCQAPEKSMAGAGSAPLTSGRWSTWGSVSTGQVARTGDQRLTASRQTVVLASSTPEMLRSSSWHARSNQTGASPSALSMRAA